MNSAMALPEADIFAGHRALGRITLQVGAADGVSHRTKVQEEGPLRVRFPDEAGQRVEAVLVNTAGGVAGGDTSVLEMVVGEGASLAVTTAAAEKVYRGGSGAAITIDLKVGRDASLAWMPRELILLDRSRLERTIDIELADDSRLLLAEAVVFADSRAAGLFCDRWRVRRAGRLVYAEDIRLDGAGARTPASAAIATILMAPEDEVFVAALNGLRTRLRGEVAASTMNGLTVARFAAADGASLRHDLVAGLTLALGGPAPPQRLN